MEVVREVLAECGITEASTFATMSSNLVDRVRFLLVEVNEARKAYLVADMPNRYRILARTLDRLYELSGDVSLSPAHREFVEKNIIEFRKSMGGEGQLRYDEARASSV